MPFTSPTLSIRTMAALCGHMKLLYEGGIPLRRAWSMLGDEGHNLALRRLSRRVDGAIEGGLTFSQALQAEGRRLPHFFSAMVTVGEKAGVLAACFGLLAEYYEQMKELREAVYRELAYPMAVILGIVIGIPIVKAVLIGATAESETALWWTVGLIVWRGLSPFVTVIVAYAIVNRFLPLRRLLFEVMFFLWPLSRLVRKLTVARFAWSMELLLRAGIPIHRAVAVSADVAELRSFRKRVIRAVRPLKEGSTLHMALSNCSYLPPTALTYIEMGEQAGRLEEAFHHIGKDQYRSAVTTLKAITTVIGAIAIILIGISVVL